jgi:putative PIN family toxin of toxin-antitoxin system
MIRVVLDTNVLAPGFSTRTPTTSAARLIDMWKQQFFELVVSEHLLYELENALADPYFVNRFPPDDVIDLIATLRLEALMTDISVVVNGVATQPEDDLVLATGLSAGASYLGTRDRQLLKLGSYGGMQIVHPADLVDILLREIEPLP